MAIIAKDTGGKDIPPINPGTHHAVCYSVVDVGTQPNFKFEPHRKVIITWELPAERAVFERDGKKEEKPRAISKEYTLSLHKKAVLRTDLTSWRSRDFTEEELKGFDLKKLIGANAMISIGHKAGTGKNAQRVFAEVKGVAALPKPPPPAAGQQPAANPYERRKYENEPLYFSLDEVPKGMLPDFPKNMPQWIQDKIKVSEEYRKMERELNGGQQTTEGQTPAGGEKIDEDVPF